jgi:hypothetical protein
MVIHVYVEGGVMPGNVDATTAANSEALREELNRFMQRALHREDISIIVKNCAGYKMAAKEFLKDTSKESYLYVDLDRVPECRHDWFVSLAQDGIAVDDDHADRVYFWIQEMEAWFLKQPQAIEDWALEEGYTHKPKYEALIANHPKIQGKDIEHLKAKASDILSVILRQVFDPGHKSRMSASGKIRHLTYGKLRHAPGIIAHLNPVLLQEVDHELAQFCKHCLLLSKE